MRSGPGSMTLGGSGNTGSSRSGKGGGVGRASAGRAGIVAGGPDGTSRAASVFDAPLGAGARGGERLDDAGTLAPQALGGALEAPPRRERVGARLRETCGGAGARRILHAMAQLLDDEPRARDLEVLERIR